MRAVAAQFWLNGMVFSSFLPRLPELRAELGLDLPGLGWALTLGSLGGFLGSAACGPLVARLGPARTTVMGGAVLVACLPLVGLARGPAAFVVAIALLHAADTVADVGMNTIGSALSAQRSAPVMSRLHGLWSVGTICGGLAATATVGVLSTAAHLAAVSGLLAATLVYVGPRLLADGDAAVRRAATGVGAEAPVEPDPDPEPGPGEAVAPGPTDRSAWRPMVVVAVLAAATVAIEMVPSDWASLALSTDLGAGDRLAGAGFVAVTGGMVVGRLCGDWLTVRLGPARLGRAALGLGVTGAVAVAVAPTAPVALAGFVVGGLGASALFPRLYDAAARAPGNPGANLGALTAGIRVGAFAVPVTVGALAGTALTVGQAMAAVVLAAALVLWLRPAR